MSEPSSGPRRATPRIVAVVVTFNRRDMVTRLVGSLDTGHVVPDEIIVVDNASSDGTSEALTALETSTQLRVLTLPENTGGAGGFHTGLETALTRDADLVWLMDDDGVPADDCLELLLEHVADHDFLGPAVVDAVRQDRLCFPIRLPGRSTVVRE